MYVLFLFLQILISITVPILIEASNLNTEVIEINQWREFMTTYKKSYKSKTEENFRMKIYKENVQKIKNHNRLFERGIVSFNLKENMFADLLETEFAELMNGLDSKISNFNVEKASLYIPPANVQILTDSIDWREKGAVTEVKNQGNCGSCWAFSATGSLEGQHFLKTKTLISLSEQDLIDCCWVYDNNGCEGGIINNAYYCIEEWGGIDTESFYPYEGKNEYTCKYNRSYSGAVVTGYKTIRRDDEESLLSAVTTVGPISVGIDASHSSFQFYSDGVYYEPACDSQYIDHAVLVVGYGTKNNTEYWIVKNSWGTSWGQNGYIFMSKNQENNCGIASMASYPLV